MFAKPHFEARVQRATRIPIQQALPANLPLLSFGLRLHKFIVDSGSRGDERKRRSGDEARGGNGEGAGGRWNGVGKRSGGRCGGIDWYIALRDSSVASGKKGEAEGEDGLECRRISGV